MPSIIPTSANGTKRIIGVRGAQGDEFTLRNPKTSSRLLCPIYRQPRAPRASQQLVQWTQPAVRTPALLHCPQPSRSPRAALVGAACFRRRSRSLGQSPAPFSSRSPAIGWAWWGSLNKKNLSYNPGSGPFSRHPAPSRHCRLRTSR